MTTQKGVARVATNIKTMDGTPTGAIATLPVGGWVFGDYNSTHSDLINVTAWYRASGEKITLAEPCKVSVTNLTVTPYTDIPPVDPPPIDPPPDTNEIISIRRSTDGITWSEPKFYRKLDD